MREELHTEVDLENIDNLTNEVIFDRRSVLNHKRDKIYIYKFTNIIDNKIYIGSTSRVYDRIKQHISLSRSKRHSNIYLYRAVEKHGWCLFLLNFKILEVRSQDNRNDRENYWINFYNALDPNCGYNLVLADNKEKSEETCKKIGDSHRGKIQTEEHRRKNSEANRGEKHWNYGLKTPRESVEKMRTKLTGRKLSEDHINTLKETQKELRNRPEYKETQRRMTEGIKAAWANKTDEELRAIGEARSKHLKGRIRSKEELINILNGARKYQKQRLRDKYKHIRDKVKKLD